MESPVINPGFPPFCGEEYNPAQVAGAPVICTLECHPKGTRHYNHELGFGWYG